MTPDQQLNQLLDSIEAPPAPTELKRRITASTQPVPGLSHHPYIGRFGPSVAFVSTVAMVIIALLIIPATPPQQEDLDIVENEELSWLIADVWEQPLESAVVLDDRAAYSFLYGIDE